MNMDRVNVGMRNADIPVHMHEGIELWVREGIEPGGFLTAVLCNDLMGAAGQADIINRGKLFNYCEFLHNYAPSGCFGSKAKFVAWREQKGLSALLDAKSESSKHETESNVSSDPQ